MNSENITDALHRACLEQAIDVYNAGDYEKAYELAEKALAISPDHTTTLYLKAECLHWLERFNESAELLRVVLKEWPFHAGASSSLFDALLTLHRYGEAMEELKRFLTHADAETYDDYLMLTLTAGRWAVDEEKELMEKMKSELRAGDSTEFDNYARTMIRINKKIQERKTGGDS